MKNTFVFATLLILIGNQPTLAQKDSSGENTKAAEKAKQKKAAPNPAFAKTIDTPGLPRVLLIGDSISIGYTLPLTKSIQSNQS